MTLSLPEREVGDHTITIGLRRRGSQPEAQPPPIEAGTVRADVELVGGAA
ncbi:MAG: hypothetical protein ACREXX_05550 [Gammaproteobacteria bacterium]